jgi:ribosomal protein S18 acetylase RimI-like enzyme
MVASSIDIQSLDPTAAATHLPALSAVLQDAVAAGASVGFLPPLSDATATSYWTEVVTAVADGSRVLLGAFHPRLGLVGTAQLDLCQRANGLHRAEIAKLMVLRAARRQGIGRALMAAIETEAQRHGRTTLVLDTRRGDPSEQLYLSLGYRFAGEIPRYARSSSGQLDATAFYYRLIEP